MNYCKSKSALFFVLFFFIMPSVSLRAYNLPSASWVKKNIMDVSPLNFFIKIKPKDEWLDGQNNYKNKLLHIFARSCEGVVPTVGSKVKKCARGVCETMLGKKNQWGIGPAKVRSKTVAYYGVNGTYSVVFAKGTLQQKVLYTLYKLFIKKMPARYMSKKFLMLTALFGINGICERTTQWWVGKDGYVIVFADVAKKAVKSTFELLIDECVGCYIIPKIYGGA